MATNVNSTVASNQELLVAAEGASLVGQWQHCCKGYGRMAKVGRRIRHAWLIDFGQKPFKLAPKHLCSNMCIPTGPKLYKAVC